MPEMRFRIGDVLDPADPVARFITVLAMIANDVLRLFGIFESIEDYELDAEGRRMLLFRYQASLHHEAADFISQARRRFPEVSTFIEGLDTDARSACDQLVGGVDPKSPRFLGEWLEEHRNVTFHYAEMHPEAAAHNAEEIAEALKAARDLVGTITEEDRLGGRVRFGFADDVVVQWLPDVDDLGTEWIERLRDDVILLGTFVREAIVAYFERLDSSTYSIE